MVVTDIPQQGIEPAKLKSIDAVLSGLPPLPEDFMALVRFAADYYHHPLGQTLFTALPTGLREPRDINCRTNALRVDAAGRGGSAAGAPARQAGAMAGVAGWPADACRRQAVTPQAGKVLADWLAEDKIHRVEPEAAPLRVADSPELNEEQQAALDALRGQAGYQPGCCTALPAAARPKSIYN